MELRQLRYFILLARELNFSRAAEKLNISQPTLSQQISAMEDELGGKLLVRNKRSVSLTETGRIMLENGEDLLYQFDNLVTRIQLKNNTPPERETLSIGVDTNDHDLDRWHVIQGITTIHRVHPRAEFRFVTVPYKSIGNAIRNHDIDVGFYTIPKGSEADIDVNYRVLRTERIALGVPESYCESHPDAPLEQILRDLPVCLGDGDFRWNSYFERILRTYAPNMTIRYFGTEGLLFDYISAGLGVFLNTETLFDMTHRVPVRKIVLPEETAGALELAVWDKNSENKLRDMLFEAAANASEGFV